MQKPQEGESYIHSAVGREVKRNIEVERRNDSHGNIRTLEPAPHMPADEMTSW